MLFNTMTGGCDKQLFNCKCLKCDQCQKFAFYISVLLPLLHGSPRLTDGEMHIQAIQNSKCCFIHLHDLFIYLFPSFTFLLFFIFHFDKWQIKHCGQSPLHSKDGFPLPTKIKWPWLRRFVSVQSLLLERCFHIPVCALSQNLRVKHTPGKLDH